MAEGLGTGLQNLLLRFKSGSDLKKKEELTGVPLFFRYNGSSFGQCRLDAHLVELGRTDAHGTRLLGDNALGTLARNGVHLEEIEFIFFGIVDIVEAHYAAAAEEVVEAVGDLLDVLGDALVDLGRAHLVAEAVVLGLVVEELVASDGDNLGDGENDLLALGRTEDAAVELAAGNELLDEHLPVFGESFTNGGQKLLAALHLGGGHTAAAGSRLDEDRVVHTGHQFVELGVGGRLLVKQDRLGDLHQTETFHHGVAVALVEGEAGGVEAAGGVADAQHVEVALQDAVLAGVAVDDDESQVEVYLLAVVRHSEVATVHRAVLAVVVPVPALAINDNFVNIVFGMVQLAIHLITTGDADVVLATVTAHDKCYILFHRFKIKLTPPITPWGQHYCAKVSFLPRVHPRPIASKATRKRNLCYLCYLCDTEPAPAKDKSIARSQRYLIKIYKI